MTDLLTTLTQRTWGTFPIAEPAIAPRFAPSSEIQEPVTRETPVVPQETQTAITDQSEHSRDIAQLRQIDAVHDGKTQSTVVRHEDTPPATQDDNLLRPQADKSARLNAEPAPQHSQSTVVRHEDPLPATIQGDNLLQPQADKSARLNAEPAPEPTPSTVVRRTDPPPAITQGSDLLRPQVSTTPATHERPDWLPTTIETARTRPASPTADQPQRSSRAPLAPKLERLVDTPATNQTRGTPQPLDEAQPSTEDALLVRPRWDRDDQHQRIRDQHQIEPHPVAEVATADTTDAPRTTKQPATEPASAPTIQVSIGRIDVRAKTPTPMPQTTPKRPQPTLSLDDYLKQRNGGRP